MPGREYLDHAELDIRNFFGPIERILFVPFAMADQEAYADKNRLRIERMGYKLRSIHVLAATITLLFIRQ